MREQGKVHTTTPTHTGLAGESYGAGSDPEAEEVAKLLGLLNQQFDEVIQILQPAVESAEQFRNEPLVLLVPGETAAADGEAAQAAQAALVLPSPAYFTNAHGEVDQERLDELFKSIGRALRKVNWKKVGKVVGKVAKGALGGISGGIPGMIMGAAGAGIGALKGGGGKAGATASRAIAAAGRAIGGAAPGIPPRIVTGPAVSVPGVAPAVTQLGHPGKQVINQYITTNCGTGGGCKGHVHRRESHEAEAPEYGVDEAVANQNWSGEYDHEAHDGSALGSPAGEQEYAVESEASGVFEFLRELKLARAHLGESVIDSSYFEWELD